MLSPVMRRYRRCHPTSYRGRDHTGSNRHRHELRRSWGVRISSRHAKNQNGAYSKNRISRSNRQYAPQKVRKPVHFT